MNASKQGLQPALSALDVRVQKRQDLPLGDGRASQPGPDEAAALAHALYVGVDGELLDVVLQVLPKEICMQAVEKKQTLKSVLSM